MSVELCPKMSPIVNLIDFIDGFTSTIIINVHVCI